MADEAEKLINISLCKMAESRTVRRGGSLSLHKHLLISTVLTKARSAYFETWYMGEGETTAVDSRTGYPVNLNSSYQELDFPLDDDDDDESDELLEDPLYDPQNSSNHPPSNMGSVRDNSALITESNNSHQIDPRFFVEVETDSETEIELPSDILNCVEKLGDISDMSFPVDDSASSSMSSSGGVATNAMVVSNVLIETSMSSRNTEETSSQPTQLTYLDLDSSLCTKETRDSFNNNTESSNYVGSGELMFGPPLCASTPNTNTSKRRRGWSSGEDSDDDDDGNESLDRNDLQSPQYRFSDELNEKLKRNGLSITNIAKRLRFSPEGEDSGVHSPGMSEEKVKKVRPFPVIMDSEFRTKKSHFEEDDQEDSDDDPFLGDALGQSPLDGDNEQLHTLSRKNDQRVPSASSGGSSSDEDGDTENSMEVEQITNLVQFISFNKHHSQSPLQLISSSS